jgi:flavin reductase (DIM6/NTAB) family NADH-FMN oxidoreductase RutF
MLALRERRGTVRAHAFVPENDQMKTPVEADKCTRLTVTRPVMIITTLHKNGVLNAGVYGAYTNVSPTDFAIAIWKGSHTYQNIVRTEEFVINVPPVDLAEKIDTFAARLPDDRSEVEEAGCQAFESTHVAVPGIEECIASIECKYLQEVDVGAHALVLGRALGGHVEEGVLTSDGRVDVVKASIFHAVAYPEPVYAQFGKVFRVG